MSTLPGSDAWRDAGLQPAEPDVPASLVDEDDDATDDTDPEDYTPAFARGDREDRANEADVVEQDTEVPVGDEGDDRA